MLIGGDTDNRSKRYIFASASICLVLAVLGLLCGFFETLKPAGDPTRPLEVDQGTDEALDLSKETSMMLVEDGDEDSSEITL